MKYKDNIFCGLKPITTESFNEKCSFTYNHNERKLEITGEMIPDYQVETEIPWYSKRKEIKTIKIDNAKSSI